MQNKITLENIRDNGLSYHRQSELLAWLVVAGFHDDNIRTAIERWANYTPAPCSWCIAEREVKPQPGDSHGICDRHAKISRAELADLIKARS